MTRFLLDTGIAADYIINRRTCASSNIPAFACRGRWPRFVAYRPIVGKLQGMGNVGADETESRADSEARGRALA